MSDMIEFIFAIAIPLVLLIIAMLIGRITERRHLADLRRRESAMAHMLITDLRGFPLGAGASPPPQMLVGQVVLGADYFRTYFANLKKLIGGRLGAYQRLMERARREALLRVVETAHAGGYDAVCNVRIDTADVGGATTNTQAKGKAVMVAILASGTAYRRAPGASHGTAIG